MKNINLLKKYFILVIFFRVDMKEEMSLNDFLKNYIIMLIFLISIISKYI